MELRNERRMEVSRAPSSSLKRVRRRCQVHGRRDGFASEIAFREMG